MGLWKRYEYLLDAQPLQTRMASGFVIGIIGDVICQIVTAKQGKKEPFDLKRMLIFATWGAIGFTPIGFWWYNTMEAIVPATLPLRGIVKVALDQLLFSTTMTAITFGAFFRR